MRLAVVLSVLIFLTVVVSVCVAYRFERWRAKHKQQQETVEANT